MSSILCDHGNNHYDVSTDLVPLYPIVNNLDTSQSTENEEWTTSRVKDEFFLDLTKSNGKYYKQAESKMYRIPLTEKNPKNEEEALLFIINFKDLSKKVQYEFLEFCKINSKSRITLFLKQVVIRLFENLNYNYAHASVMKKLRVKIVHEV